MPAITESCSVCSKTFEVIHRWQMEERDGAFDFISVVEDIQARKLQEDELVRYRNHLEEIVAERTAQLDLANSTMAAQQRFVGRLTDSVPGPLGYVDADGMYYVVDRKKDVIIRGGENIYCAEVEAALLEHPLVRDATVIGLPHPEYGEEVAAVIQVDPANQSAALEGELVADLSAKLAKFKIPTSIHITELDLPRTATGKVLKREIRVQFFAEKAGA